MYKFAELNSDKAALLFADYCLQHGLNVHVVVQHPKLAELYIATTQRDAVEQEFARFLQEPAHPRYQAAAWQRAEPLSASVLPEVSWHQVWRQPFTLLIILLCVSVYVWQQVDWPSALGLLQLTRPTELWRWFTPALLHFSLTHLVFNLIWWLILGRQMEQRLGTAILFGFALSVAVLSNAAQYLVMGSNFGGLSGVVYALFGYCWLAGKLNPAQGLSLSPGLAGFMLLWLLLGFMDVLWVSMANWAHLFGLIAGLGWAVLLRSYRPH